MKSLDKNIYNSEEVKKHIELQTMQRRLTAACLNNDLCVATTIDLDSEGMFYMSYAVRFHGEQRDVFIGRAYATDTAHYAFVLRAALGEVVSEVCPPAIPFVNPGEDYSKRIPVAYWKTIFRIEYDTTDTVDGDDHEIAHAREANAYRESYWVGYNSNHEEIIRVKHGAENPGYDRIERIQYVKMGDRGTVVAVMYKNDKLEPGQEPTLGQALQAAAKAKFVAMAADDTSFALPAGNTPPVDSKVTREVIIPEIISVSKLADLLSDSTHEIIKYVNSQGCFITMNSVLDHDMAVSVATEFGFTVLEVEKPKTEEPSTLAIKATKEVVIPELVNAVELAKLLSVAVDEVLHECIEMDMTVTVSQVIDRETASIIATKLGFEVSAETKTAEAEKNLEEVEQRRTATEKARQAVADEVAAIKAKDKPKGRTKKAGVTPVEGRKDTTTVKVKTTEKKTTIPRQTFKKMKP